MASSAFLGRPAWSVSRWNGRLPSTCKHLKNYASEKEKSRAKRSNMIIRDEVLPALIFFNEEEARIVEAMTARIIPGSPGNPGAKEAGAVIYIDRALAGFFSHIPTFYREGIADFD